MSARRSLLAVVAAVALGASLADESKNVSRENASRGASDATNDTNETSDGLQFSVVSTGDGWAVVFGDGAANATATRDDGASIVFTINEDGKTTTEWWERHGEGYGFRAFMPRAHRTPGGERPLNPTRGFLRALGANRGRGLRDVDIRDGLDEDGDEDGNGHQWDTIVSYTSKNEISYFTGDHLFGPNNEIIIGSTSNEPRGSSLLRTRRSRTRPRIPDFQPRRADPLFHVDAALGTRPHRRGGPGGRRLPVRRRRDRRRDCNFGREPSSGRRVV